MEDNPFAPRVVTCLTHRKERATHICTDLNCTNSPLLCQACMGDHRVRSGHQHQSSLRPLGEGVQWLTSTIRSQSKSMEMIYERTIGSRECEIIKFNLEKGGILFEQLDSRLQSMRVQLQSEMDTLLREFQRQVQLQRQQFHRRFEDYKRLFSNNLQLLKRDNVELMAFQNSVRYYNNVNSFTLKLINESQRKSQEWILGQKKILGRIVGILDSPGFTSSNAASLSKATKSNLFIFPYWKGEKLEQSEIER